MRKNLSSLIIILLILGLLPWQGLVSSLPKAMAADPVIDTSEDSPAVVNLEQQAPLDNEGGEEADWNSASSSTSQTSDLTTISTLVSNIKSRRVGGGDHTIEYTLPRLGMSQCDMQLVRGGKIDKRILEALNHLVTPVKLGGAGMTYLHVTFSKGCEEEVPDLIGGAYPVDFVDDAPKPPPPKKDTGSTPQPTANIVPQIIPYSTIPQRQFEHSNAYNNLASLITPVASAAASKNLRSFEPDGAEAVHDRGQAVDITAAGLVMCTSKSGGVFGVGAKITRQAPRPIKVAWQTDAGVANVTTPFGQNFDAMAQTAGLDQFLEGFTSQDGTFRAHALDGAFTMMGFNLLANLAGVKPGSFNPETSAFNYQTLGYALLADTLKLPDASVFNPLISPDFDASNPYAAQHNNFERLLQAGITSTIERDLKMQRGSLRGNTFEDVLISAGKGRMEQELNLAPGSLSANLNNPEAMIRSIGQGRLDAYFHWPLGTSRLKSGAGSTINALIDQMVSKIDLPDKAKPYAQTLVTSSLHLPNNVSVQDLTNKNSSFWKSDQGKQTKDSLHAIDQQLFPTSVSMDSVISSEAGVPVFGNYYNQYKDKSDLTYSWITGDISDDQYNDAMGVGAVLSAVGPYADSTDSINRAFDLFPDQTTTGYVDTAGAVVGRNPVKNEFLANVLKGSKNNLMALGVDTIAKALQMHPDERMKHELVQAVVGTTSGKHGSEDVTATVDKYSGMVYDALRGKLDTVHFSTSKASLSLSLSPAELLTVFGQSLAKDSTGKDADKLAKRRFDSLVAMGKERFGDALDQAARNTIADPVILNKLYQYDASRPSTKPTEDTFILNGDGQRQFGLSQPAVSLTKATLILEGTERDVSATLSTDKRAVIVDQDAMNSASGGDSLRISYVGRAQKANTPTELGPDTFLSLINDTKAMSHLAVQIGASKVSQALNLPPNALAYAANLADPSNKTGVGGVGQAALELAGNLRDGELSTGSLSDVYKNISQTNIERMFLLEPGWYSKVVRKDSDFFQYQDVGLYTTDQYYHIDLGSTKQLFLGEITFDQYKKRIGQNQLKFNAGSVLASQFNIQVAGYRLNQQDFYNILDGSYYNVIGKIGARLQERNHGLPVGSLAYSLITGQHDLSLWALGTNAVASTFHLQNIDLTHANSITEVQQQVGISTIEQGLGFKAGTFKGDHALDIADSVGAESFASAFGIPIPANVKAQLDQTNTSYHQDAIQSSRNKIVSTYLHGLLDNSPINFSQNTLNRFDALDRTFELDKQQTEKFISGLISTDDYIKKASAKAVARGIKGELASLLGIPEAYVIKGEQIINLVTKGDNCTNVVGKTNTGQNIEKTSACGDTFKNLVGIVSDMGGINFDAAIGWDKGAFKYLVNHSDNPIEVKKLVITQGTKRLARLIGIDEDKLKNLDLPLFHGQIDNFEAAFHNLADVKIAATLNVPGYTAIDANYLLNGPYSDGITLAGAALMAKSDDMKKAGITYDELKLSVLGDPAKETDFVWTKVAEHSPGLTKQQLMNDQEFAWLADPAKNPGVEADKREFMTNTRQAVSFKFMDFQARQLLPDVIIPAGFTRAMVGGQYTYQESGQTISLTGDAARWQMGKLVLIDYAKKNIGVLNSLPSPVALMLTDYFADGDSKRLESRLKGFTDPKGNGFVALGSVFDGIASKIFGGNLAPGTGQAMIGFAFDGNVNKLGNNIWQAWQGTALSFADKALGLKPGTAGVMYQGIVGYQTALASYRASVNAALDGVIGAATAGDAAAFDAAFKSADKQLNSASRQLKTQTAMLIATAVNFVFAKQIAQIEGALGLKPGTLMYLIQYLIHPDPISLGLFIFFQFFWGGSSTSCGIDFYPRGKGGGTPADILALQTALGYQTASTQTVITPTQNSTSGNTTTANPITQLQPPKQFNGQNNDSYRKGIKAGAQYEVRRTVGNLLLMPKTTQDLNLTPTQIGTYSVDDINLFEKISVGIYGPNASRGKRGPGWSEKMTDRVHLGY